MPQSKFSPEQAVELAAAFARHQVEYLFLGKSGAILLGYPLEATAVTAAVKAGREVSALWAKITQILKKRKKP